MPLNPIHFNPTSLINSAVATASWSGEAAWNSSASESGEFIVMVVAVCFAESVIGMALSISAATYSHRQPSRHTNTPLLSILSQILIKALDALRCWQCSRTRKWRIDELLESRRKFRHYCCVPSTILRKE